MTYPVDFADYNDDGCTDVLTQTSASPVRLQRNRSGCRAAALGGDRGNWGDGLERGWPARRACHPVQWKYRRGAVHGHGARQHRNQSLHPLFIEQGLYLGQQSDRRRPGRPARGDQHIVTYYLHEGTTRRYRRIYVSDISDGYGNSVSTELTTLTRGQLITPVDGRDLPVIRTMSGRCMSSARRISPIRAAHPVEPTARVTRTYSAWASEPAGPRL